MFFKVIKEKLYNPEIGFYISFGIEAVDEDSENTVTSVSDVFLYEDKAREFAGLLNECKADAVHLQELCEAEIEQEYFL